MLHNEIIVYNNELVSWRFHWTTSYRPPFPNFSGPKFFESSIAGNWKANFESFFSNDDESSKLMTHWNSDSFLLLSFRKSLHRTQIILDLEKTWFLIAGIHGPPMFRDFQNLVGPGPVRDLEIFLGPGRVRTEKGTGPNRSFRDQPVSVHGFLPKSSNFQKNIYFSVVKIWPDSTKFYFFLPTYFRKNWQKNLLSTSA